MDLLHDSSVAPNCRNMSIDGISKDLRQVDGYVSCAVSISEQIHTKVPGVA